MPTASPINALLTAAMPPAAGQRLLLHTLRRMAMGGLEDAFAAHTLIGAFGHSFRRPLVLIRALMAETSRCATRKIVVAPCCCPRLTQDEADLIEAIAIAPERPAVAHERLCTTFAVETCLGVLTTAQAVAQCFADLGRPLER